MNRALICFIGRRIEKKKYWHLRLGKEQLTEKKDWEPIYLGIPGIEVCIKTEKSVMKLAGANQFQYPFIFYVELLVRINL